MRRSDIGPLGTVTVVLTLLIQVAALSQAESSGDGRGPAALIAAVVTGRLAITWAGRRGVPAARPDGLGALVAGTVRPAIPAAITLGRLPVAAVVISVGRSSASRSAGASRWPWRPGWPRPTAWSGTPCAGSAASPGTSWAR